MFSLEDLPQGQTVFGTYEALTGSLRESQRSFIERRLAALESSISLRAPYEKISPKQAVELGIWQVKLFINLVHALGQNH